MSLQKIINILILLVLLKQGGNVILHIIDGDTVKLVTSIALTIVVGIYIEFKRKRGEWLF